MPCTHKLLDSLLQCAQHQPRLHLQSEQADHGMHRELQRTHLQLHKARVSCANCFAALQVMYDASGVRLHAGKQATVLNIIISQLPADHPGSGETPLRDRLGHTPRQVWRCL